VLLTDTRLNFLHKTLKADHARTPMKRHMLPLQIGHCAHSHFSLPISRGEPIIEWCAIASQCWTLSWTEKNRARTLHTGIVFSCALSSQASRICACFRQMHASMILDVWHATGSVATMCRNCAPRQQLHSMCSCSHATEQNVHGSIACFSPECWESYIHCSIARWSRYSLTQIVFIVHSRANMPI
jgi:hypothetical protein